MPRPVSHTPGWLRRPSPGHDFFSQELANRKSPDQQDSSNAPDVSQSTAPPPARRIAVRGSQVFLAKHNQLRWGDLAHFSKTNANVDEQSRHPFVQSIEETTNAYRVLKVPIHDEIEQLALSHNNSFLAIATAQTVHIAILPDPYHLDSDDTGSLKLKTFQVGPTTHVMGRSRVVSILWHPLGVNGSCLTTITQDATVRLWEFDTANRMSVNSAALAIDLKRLANGKTSFENYSPSKVGSVGFSAEIPYMEVSAACYAGAGGSDIQRDAGWATTTLWVGTTDGALYALCPFLPSKFAASPRMIDEMAATACLSAAGVDNANTDEGRDDLKITLDQLTWINGIEKHHRGDDFDVNLTVFNRPSRPGPIPMLQGPYRTEPEPDAIFDITDLFAISKGVPSESVDEDDFEIIEGQGSEERVPVNALCIATSDGRVHVCFDLNETEPRWLPAQKHRDTEEASEGGEELPELLLLDSIEVDSSATLGRPMFTADHQTQTGVFVTHSQGVTHVSLAELMQKIAEETQGEAEAGSSFRLKLALEENLAADTLIRLPRPVLGPDDGSTPSSGRAVPSACVALHDRSLGNMILTESLGEPFAAVLDYDNDGFIDSEIGGDLDMDGAAGEEVLRSQAARDTYVTPQEFHSSSTLPGLRQRYEEKNPRRSWRDPVRISTANLELMTEAHTILATETHRINDAVSRLFTYTERLREEYREQLKQAGELHERIERIADDDDGFEAIDSQHQTLSTEGKTEDRIKHARERQEMLQERFEELRRQVGELDKRPLNGKELEWIRQVEQISEATDSGQGNDEAEESVARRLELVRDMKDELIVESQAVVDEGNGSHGAEAEAAPVSGRRRVGSAAIRSMLERERAMVEATSRKVEELMGVRLAGD